VTHLPASMSARSCRYSKYLQHKHAKLCDVYTCVLVMRTDVSYMYEIPMRTYHIISQTFAMAPINQSSSVPHITNTIVVDNIDRRLYVKSI